jgi:hypothetical protein
LARLILTRSRTFGIGLAVASIAFASCGKHSNTTPTPVSTVSAAPTPTGSAPISLSSPCASTVGIAYEPDGGNGNGFTGIQVSHFEDNSRHLCANVTPTTLAGSIRLDSAVGPLAMAQDSSDTVALLFNSAVDGYSFVQDLFGGEVGQLVPAGTPYDLSVAPTPIPTTTASSSASASPLPALIANGTSETILGDGTAGVALTVGPNTSPQGIVALTSLTNAPPQYGNYVPFSAPTYTLKTPAGTAFNNIRAMTVTNSTATTTTILARGTNDLIAIGVTAASTGYQFDVKAEDTNLGSNVPLVGYGRMAIDPADSSRALVGGTTSGNSSLLTLVTGLPNAITESATLTLPGTITSIAYTPTGGAYAVVGTTAGIVVINGAGSGSALAVLTPFSGATAYTPTYTNCNGTQSTLSNVASVGLSADLQYLVALGTTPGVTCASGYNASLVAVYFSSALGATPAPSSIPTPTAAPSGSPSPSPVPTFFQQNNVIAPPTNADFLVVH